MSLCWMLLGARFFGCCQLINLAGISESWQLNPLIGSKRPKSAYPCKATTWDAEMEHNRELRPRISQK